MRHPHFLDGRQVDWLRSLDEALAAARASGKKVFVQYGRQRCEGSRALVEKTIVKEEIAEFLNQHFVAVAADADAPEPAVTALVEALPKKEPTPLLIYLASDGRLLHSTAGGRPAAVLLRDMTEAVAKK